MADNETASENTEGNISTEELVNDSIHLLVNSTNSVR